MSRKRRWRRSGASRGTSVVRGIARRLRMIARRIQTRLVLRRPHARDAIRARRRDRVLLAVERLRGVLAVGIVVVGWSSVGGGLLLLLAVVVFGIGVVVGGEQTFLLLGGLRALHFHVVVWQSTLAGCGGEGGQGVFVERFVVVVWLFVRAG
jgi:hypothetical protein